MTNSHDCLLNACFRQFFSLSTDNCPIFILYREIYYTIGHVRYINILTWLRGFRVKIVKFFCFFCLSERKTWQLRDTKCDIIQTGLNQSSKHEEKAAREKNGECISYECEVNKRIES